MILIHSARASSSERDGKPIAEMQYDMGGKTGDA